MEPQRVIGRYAVFDAIASGGMATVYYGRLLGPVGFSRTVAIKQLHPQFSRDPDFVSMFVDEARLAARLRHPNVVPVLDVVKHGRELYIIMEYVLGVSLSELLRQLAMRSELIPRPVVSALAIGALEGLHAAHETQDERGESLGIVHRDVSPANILVARDGLARVLDFGIAKAAGRAQVTRHGEIKGKVGYMAPEQLRGDHVTRAADLFAMAVTLWEMLTGRRGYVGDSDKVLEARAQGEPLPPLEGFDPALAAFEPIVARGIVADPEARWPTARAMAEALAKVMPPASSSEVASWVEGEAERTLADRAKVVASLETGASASEVRAAIRKDLSLSEPSVSVDTWSGSEEELARLWESGSAAWEDSQDPSKSASTSRDDVHTKVESFGSRGSGRRSAPPEAALDASAAPIPLTTPSQPPPAPSQPPPAQPAPAFDESTTLLASRDSTPPWLEPTSATTRRPPPWGAAAALTGVGLVTVVIAVSLLAGGSGEAPETSSAGTPPPTVAASEPEAVAETPEATPAAEDAPPSETEPAGQANDEEPDEEADPEETPQAEETSTPAPAARPRAPRGKKASPRPKTKDPFDALGGRH